MSTVTCGVTVTEILVAVGENYWRCVACQLRFSRFSSIDEHIRHKHGNTDTNIDPASNNVKVLVPYPQLDSAFDTPPSIEGSLTNRNNVTSVPSVFKVNLDNPNLKEPIDTIQNSLNTAVQGPNSSSTTHMCTKSHSIPGGNSSNNPETKFGNIGHLIISGNNCEQPFVPNESPVISELLNHNVDNESLVLNEPQLGQANDCENVDDLDADGNVSKAMLASMLSLLEKGLEMDDISSVFQNLDSVSPEFFEQQLLNHSDLVDGPSDSFDSSLESFPNQRKGNNKNVLGQSQSNVIKEDKAVSLKEVAFQNGHNMTSDNFYASKNSLGGKSKDFNVDEIGKTSCNTSVPFTTFNSSMLCESDIGKQTAELQRKNENSELQAETTDLSFRNIKFPPKQTKCFGQMSSLWKENQSKSLEKVSCNNNIKYDRNSKSSKTPQCLLDSTSDDCSKTNLGIPLSSNSDNYKIAKNDYSKHFISRNRKFPYPNTIFCGQLKKKRVKFKKSVNTASLDLHLVNCSDGLKTEKQICSRFHSGIVKLPPFRKNMDYLSNNETDVLDYAHGETVENSVKETKMTVKYDNWTNIRTDVKNEVSKSLMKLAKSTDIHPTTYQRQLITGNKHPVLKTRSTGTSLVKQKCVESKRIEIDVKNGEVCRPSTLTRNSGNEMFNTPKTVASDDIVKSNYICTVCDANFSSSGALWRHMKVNFALTNPCECKVCHKKFHCLSVLSVHVFKCHRGLGNPVCLVCYVKCSNTKILLQHVRIHQKTEAKRVCRLKQVMSSSVRERIRSKYWRCGKCNAIILNEKKIIKSHICIVSKTCKQCNIDFPTVSTFKVHMASHKGRMFECNVCGEFFKNKAARDYHKQTHKGNFLCQICGKQFAHQHMLSKHSKIHTQVRKASPALTCAECNKVYKCKRSFQRHINIAHLGMEYEFQCVHCPQKFLTSNQLREHVAWQHFGEKSHPCRYCDKTFVCRPTLIRHERNEHTGVKPYKCRFCTEAFVEKKYLDMHEVKQHTLVFPYNCDVCGKGFVQASCLRSHLLTHKKYKPHQCDICGACFSKLYHLKRHTITCLKKHSETGKSQS